MEDIDPVALYGAGNANLHIIRSMYPKLRIVARDNVIKVLGDEEQLAAFEESIEKMQQHVVKHNCMKEEVVLEIINGKGMKDDEPDGVVVYSLSGRPIKARGEHQQQLIDDFHNNDMIFAVGPAGTGKTYIAVAMAVNAFKNKEVQKIILARPAVEAGERLGFLPGDLQDKVDPYLRPLYDALYDVLGRDAALRLKEKEAIEVVPLAYMRGRTLDNSFIILDEAQNTTREQMKMFLTRMGFGSKVVVTGDVTQIDLPKGKKSGLVEAARVLRNIKGIEFCYLKDADVVRHELVKRIINAYDRYYKKYPEELQE